MRYNFKPPLQPRLYCLCGTLLLRRLHLISLLRKYPIIAERLQANTTSGPASISAHRLIPGVGFTMISRPLSIRALWRIVVRDCHAPVPLTSDCQHKNPFKIFREPFQTPVNFPSAPISFRLLTRRGPVRLDRASINRIFPKGLYSFS